MTVICLISVLYSTAQCKLERRLMRYGLNTTRCSFYTCASMHVHARLMMSNLSFKTLMYVRTRRVHDSLQTDACLSGTHMPNLDYVYAKCKTRTTELSLSKCSCTKV